MHTFTLTEALEEFEDILPEIRRACVENADAIVEEYIPYLPLNVDREITKADVHRHVNYLFIEKKLQPILNSIKRIDSYLYFKRNPYRGGGVTDYDIQRAKSVDENWFISEASLSTRSPHTGLCFNHNDKNASLTLMKSKQSGNLYLKCFVCNQSWNSVSLKMDRDKMSFMEAVKYIIY